MLQRLIQGQVQYVRRLDGQIFDYNKGPTPPQHFNCRSTTVPVVDL